MKFILLINVKCHQCVCENRGARVCILGEQYCRTNGKIIGVGGEEQRQYLGTENKQQHIFFGCCAFYGGGSVVVDFLFIVTPIVGVCNCSMFCCTLLYVHSSIAIVLMGKRELVALLNLSSWCLVMVEWLFFAVP